MKKLLSLVIIVLAITSCGAGSSSPLSVTTQNGVCASGVSSAPYCMSVTMSNNNGDSTGQMFINSTTFPISGISLSLSGATNVNSPVNTSTMDPNGCMGSTIDPGKSCTFYFQINGENSSYSVESVEQITAVLTYNVNNVLFAQGTTTNNYTSTFTFNENTNLYILQGNFTAPPNYAWVYNAGNLTYQGNIESADSVQAMAADTTSYGILYLGGALGVYTYGGTSTAASSSIAPPSGLISIAANSLNSLSGTLYAAVPGIGIWGYSLASQTWNTSILASFTTPFISDISAFTPNNTQFYATTNTVYNCSATSGSSNTCVQEGIVLTGSSVTGLLYAQGLPSPFTGLFISTSNDLLIESGVLGSSFNLWVPIGDSESQPISGVMDLNADASGNLYAGDNNGNIWIFNSASLTDPSIPAYATKYLQPALTGSTIEGMTYNAAINRMYFVAQNNLTGVNNLYSCQLGQVTCTAVNLGALSPNVPTISLNVASSITR